MWDNLVFLAAVTILGVLEQAYFSLQVIYSRRKFGISPPATSGHPDFERVFRAQVNCSEYFPIFLAMLWVAGIFFHQGITSFFGLLYLYSRYLYFRGYSESAKGRLAPLYLSAKVLWALIGLATLGVLDYLSSYYLGFSLVAPVKRFVGL
ncbi:leukotriene C4 synthase isoform X2 [Callorhinchus milii]|uniref:leukotriene C4 synthase isoform X2 n=1 Tax=Callorhinchus milii TaxID=7868 RepID=UPI0004572CFA|nr:leukotriene C4 synthase isoform X2 [Callorhinchus milii]|eukprot:gi/632979187/ref/XP_007906330.1/ PREDICTED: leukotriene C4 synthase isoform X2 [Callorhinchus milii]